MTRCRTSRPAGAATAFAGALIALLLSCGGGSFEQGLPPFPASRCAVPPPGVDPQGTRADEKAWLRQWTDQPYLCYPQDPASAPEPLATALAYFHVLKTIALT